jgi:hypothetical protein
MRTTSYCLFPLDVRPAWVQFRQMIGGMQVQGFLPNLGICGDIAAEPADHHMQAQVSENTTPNNLYTPHSNLMSTSLSPAGS